MVQEQQHPESTQPANPAGTTSVIPQAVQPALGLEPHLFDRLAVLYKYRWAAVGMFLLVVGWVMVDSYTAVPMYRATARVLVEDPGADVATPSQHGGSCVESRNFDCVPVTVQLRSYRPGGNGLS